MDALNYNTNNANFRRNRTKYIVCVAFIYMFVVFFFFIVLLYST